jgi:FkbM family methyltransferase
MLKAWSFAFVHAVAQSSKPLDMQSPRVAMMQAPGLLRSVFRKMEAVIRLACWKILQPKIILSSGVALTVKTESDWEVAQEIFVERDYDDAILQAFSSGDNGTPVRIVDLGANVGFFSLRCIHLHLQAKPQAHLELLAVEGAPSLCADLEERLSRGRDPNVNLIIKQGLVGHRTGKAMIYSSSFSSCTNAIVQEDTKVSRNPLLNRHAEECQYLDLDQLIDPLAMVDLIKCDIEGSECDFLQSYVDLLKRTRLLVIELHPHQCNVNTCRELLTSYGFLHMRTIKNQPTHSLEMYQNRQFGVVG